MIYPRELEEILFTHPKVAQVAVVSVPDAYFGENACACVIPKPGESVSLDDLNRFLSDQIAKYKRPQRLELFGTFPFTATGKIQKHVLRQMVLERQPTDLA
jgi:non-ribosomal peptide synthetase component E (peptide arylation enzyme)